MAGAGFFVKRHTPACFAVAILTDLEWPVLVLL